ncbi:hypothetical protein AAFO92_06595 [Roseovarius sp. CAU 1744]|uniref:hypothetical protein n=1 Tax=Roseovarius sp. CAU 1744 TaxID=3140368 RepID=UPI00325B8E08
MPRSDPYVVVHGGVHKTATSYIQSILQRNAGRMGKRGVHYVHHRDTRKEFTYPCQLNGYEKLGLDYRRKFPDDTLRKATRQFFDKIGAKSGERIILSDENMPGHCGQCVNAGVLYNRRDVLIPIFAREIAYPVQEVHLALRNYADFFAAAYVEYLRSASGDKLVTEAQMKLRLLSNLPSWKGFIEVVSDAFPDARLVLWPHEEFGRLSQRIIQNLSGPGIDVEKFAQPKRSRGRPTASHRAVQELLIEIDRIGGAAALEKRVEIQERFPKGDKYPAYDPWSQHERAHLTRMYERDLEEVAGMERVTFLRAGDT